MNNKKQPPKHLKLVAETTVPVPPLDTPDAAPAAGQDPCDVHAHAVASDLFDFVRDGTLGLVFTVGVGANGKFFRNLGGAGNAYELLGLIEIQKQELLNVITYSQKAPSGGAASQVDPGNEPGDDVPPDTNAVSE